MKIKNILIIALLILSSSAYSQFRNGVGLHLVGMDFYGPLTGNLFLSDNTYKSGADTVTKKQLNWTPAVRISYWRNGVWTDNLDVNFNWTVGSGNTPINDSMLSTNDFKTLTDFDLRLAYNILSKWEHKIAPYLHGGVSLANHGQADKYGHRGWGFSIPVGLGFNINLTSDHALQMQLETGYWLTISNNAFDNYQNSIGAVYFFDGGRKTPPPPPPPADTDGDGIPDDIDKCPDMAGPAALGGCPDTDGDGIPDMLDACPTEAGPAESDGCPVKDSDGDGIPDDEDQCPNEKGVAAYNGCPIPDSDGDGFNDEVDKCPNVASKINNGCPVIKEEVVEKIKEAAGQVHFETNKAVLTEDSDDNLDVIAELLKENPDYKCDINGYTDASGSYDYNVKLSDERAKVCYDYLISKGIDASRLTYKGYGPENPVASNDTKEGKAKNRRTEFKVHL